MNRNALWSVFDHEFQTGRFRRNSRRRSQIAKNHFNISPSRYIHTGAGEEYRPLAEIVEELDALDQEAKSTDASLRGILDKLGIGT